MQPQLSFHTTRGIDINSQIFKVGGGFAVGAGPAVGDEGGRRLFEPAVGAFFAGSNTVSNMTFGGIQDSIAQSLDLSRTTILSLQSVGGAMGNMVCINNIVAVCSIVGILDKEGYILKRTVIPMIIYGLIAACVAYFL